LLLGVLISWLIYRSAGHTNPVGLVFSLALAVSALMFEIANGRTPKEGKSRIVFSDGSQ
jgi:hypothetical protein